MDIKDLSKNNEQKTLDIVSKMSEILSQEVNKSILRKLLLSEFDNYLRIENRIIKIKNIKNQTIIPLRLESDFKSDDDKIDFIKKYLNKR